MAPMAAVGLLDVCVVDTGAAAGGTTELGLELTTSFGAVEEGVLVTP